MKYKFVCKSVKDLPPIADVLLQTYKNERLFAFLGSLGSGKTTFIKEICKKLGVVSMVNSPTFSIINEYYNEDGDSIYHFDFYRIEKKEEVFDIGYEDYFFSEKYCFIEWPERILELLPKNTVYINIKEDLSSGFRIFEF